MDPITGEQVGGFISLYYRTPMVSHLGGTGTKGHHGAPQSGGAGHVQQPAQARVEGREAVVTRCPAVCPKA